MLFFFLSLIVIVCEYHTSINATYLLIKTNCGLVLMHISCVAGCNRETYNFQITVALTILAHTHATCSGAVILAHTHATCSGAVILAHTHATCSGALSDFGNEILILADHDDSQGSCQIP